MRHHWYHDYHSRIQMARAWALSSLRPLASGANASY